MSRFDKTDKVFRQIILKERPNLCEHCRKKDGRQVYVAHILPKGTYPRLRYQRPNILLLCYWCHMEWAHKNPLEFREWLCKYKGESILNDLRLMDRMLPKMDLKMVHMCLKEQLKEIKNAQL